MTGTPAASGTGSRSSSGAGNAVITSSKIGAAGRRIEGAWSIGIAGVAGVLLGAVMI